MAEYLEKEERYLYREEETFGAKTRLVRAFVMKNYSIGMHEQDFTEINIITRGKGFHYIEGRRIEAEPGGVFIIPPRMSHGYSGGEGFDVCHILISNRFLKKYTGDLQLLPSFFTLFTAEPMMRPHSEYALHLTLESEPLERIRILLKELLSIEERDTYADMARVGLTLTIIAELCRSYEMREVRTSPVSSADRSFMEVVAMLHESFGEKITIEDMAKRARLSRSSFIKKFAEICGTTPAKYLLDLRLDAAQKMLLSTSYPIGEVAARCGFCDGAHLTRSFIKRQGSSPAAYRRSRGHKGGDALPFSDKKGSTV